MGQKFYSEYFQCLSEEVLKVCGAVLVKMTFLFDLGLTWWINDIHGVSIEYNRGFDKRFNFIGLKYLYSWQ